VPTARLLLLVNYRPEYRHDWGGKTYFRQLRLDPLGPENATALLETLLGGDAGLEPLKRLFLVRTEGNPSFWRRACGASRTRGPSWASVVHTGS
jgi:predicted ATPase